MYFECNSQIEKEVLAKKQQVQADDINFDTLKLDFENLTRDKEIKFDDLVKNVLEQPDRAKWKTDFEHQWIKFKVVEKLRWIERFRTFFHSQLKYDLHVAECKKRMRQFIRDMFADEESGICAEEEKRLLFSELFEKILTETQQYFPSVNVINCIDNVYKNSVPMRTLQIDLFNKETIFKVEKEINQIFGNSNATADGSILKSIQSAISSSISYLWSNNQQQSRQQKLDEEILREIVSYLQHAETYMDTFVDKVIDLTIKITKKLRCRNQEVQHAHIFAKLLVTQILAEIQKKWENENSVSAKLNSKSTRQEMTAYFDSVSQGIQATELLVKTLSTNLLQILPEAFQKEMIRILDLRVRTKTWLSDPKALRARIDLALIQLIDQNKVDELLENVRNLAEFYDRVLLDLIAIEIPDLEKEFESFSATVKGALKSAIAAASLVPAEKAKKLIDELNSQFLLLFRDNYLAMNLISDSEGYEGCDNEEDDVFREKCLQIIEHCAAVLWERNWNAMFMRQPISRKVLTYMQDVRREDVSRPRCRAACPHCHSLCIHPANHDTLAVKHDTHHQPEGLVGLRWASNPGTEKSGISDTLCYETCSMSLENDEFFIEISSGNTEVKYYRDFDKHYPAWMNPKLMERLPLREFIFANYQDAIAKKYQVKKCLGIPPGFYHDLETLRQYLERTANLSQDM